MWLVKHKCWNADRRYNTWTICGMKQNEAVRDTRMVALQYIAQMANGWAEMSQLWDFIIHIHWRVDYGLSII